MIEAEKALAAWGGGRVVRFLKDRENAVYEVDLPGPGRAALRLHRPAYQSLRAIRSELWWMQALAKSGLPVPVPVPMPIPTLAGDLVSDGSGRVATVIGWVEGDALGEADVPLNASDDHIAQFAAIGVLLARMHAATDAMALPEWFDRPRWDTDGLLGEAPVWGRFWENPALSDAERSLVLKARGKATVALQEFGKNGADFGLIHADVLRENVLFSGETVSIIDFDDCGFGFRMYDFATLASQNEDEPNHAELMAAAVTGYRSERDLPQGDVAMLPLFVMLRRFASMGWIVDRVPEGDARLRLYAGRAVRAAERFLQARP